MNTLIIYAHPGNTGHCTYTLEQVIKGLRQRKESYEIIDLYKIRYDPVLHPNEHYTSGRRDITKQNKELQHKIKQSSKFIIIHPVWWGSVPAILKGFFDRVFTGRFAFTYKPLPFNFFGLNSRPVGLLHGKAAIFISTGSLKWVSRCLQPTSRTYAKKLLTFVGITSKVYQIGKAQQCTREQKERIKNNVSKGLDWLL